jgi:hypothetical protein
MGGNLRSCSTTVYTRGELAGWSTVRQSQKKLYIHWKIKHNGVIKNTLTLNCTGATGGLSTCIRTGPQYTVSLVEPYGNQQKEAYSGRFLGVWLAGVSK